MVCAEAGSVVAVEVFVELDIIAPVRIFLKFLFAPIYRPVAVFTFQENAAQAA
jgi:hypothetical protein